MKLCEAFSKPTYRIRREGNLTEAQQRQLSNLLARGLANNVQGAIHASKITPGYNFSWTDLLTDDETYEMHLMEVTDLLMDQIKTQYSEMMRKENE